MGEVHTVEQELQSAVQLITGLSYIAQFTVTLGWHGL